jgi:hypothetical protein
LRYYLYYINSQHIQFNVISFFYLRSIIQIDIFDTVITYTRIYKLTTKKKKKIKMLKFKIILDFYKYK